MNSLGLWCFFCVKLLFQISCAENSDVSRWIQDDHIILIFLAVIACILSPFAIVFLFWYCSGFHSKDPERENVAVILEKDDKEKEDMRKRIDFLEKCCCRDTIVLDADTAHPRLEVFEEGKSVRDSGTVRKVATDSTRFDSHTFILATEGFTSGKHYWEVNVGKKNNWELGVASESVGRKGTLTLCPKNGFWVIALVDGRDYWARTEPWTRLTVRKKPQKIGIFLDIANKQLSFYDVHSQIPMYTFTITDGDGRKGKLYPFFSTGITTARPDHEPLRLCPKEE
ncbi:E3 ubiquitin-protein ligase TRIM39-like isoform X2 [Dromaius novaehollandiae]|uniref:E3 ubiquitin-protein ligase TRIM39-like isoform X2 n=1 Tax=Dromaius novaehollandiae TaxID=8790 RepID=UPI00311EB362